MRATHRRTAELGSLIPRICAAGILGLAFFSTGQILCSAAEPTAGLPDGWRRRITVPAVKLGDVVVRREWRVTMWTKMGWLVIRRSTVEDDLDWQVVLARASEAEKPHVKINEATGSIEIRYRGYFLRDGIHGRLRLYRERKSENSPEWPRLTMDGDRRSLGNGGGNAVYLKTFALEHWCWIESGVSENGPDVWIRLQPTTVRPGDASRGNAINGVHIMRDGPLEMFYGDSQVQDEGDLLIATRTTVEEAERGLDDVELPETLRKNIAPQFSAQEWFNTKDPVELDQLAGRVVLVMFWERHCEAAVNRLARVEDLRKKLGDRGLAVIGVHPAGDREGLEHFINSNRLSFPVMIDNGETNRQYQVGALPNFFLISKSGDVVWGYAIAPPTDAQVEELLK